jgi:hypothetical protein
MLPSSGMAFGQPAPEAVMRLQPLDKRLDVVERKVESLETLPDRMTTLTSEFSELRSDFSHLRLEFSQLRVEMRGGFSAVHGRIDETRAQMRVLHEEVLARFALLDEHLGRKPPARRRAPKTDHT